MSTTYEIYKFAKPTKKELSVIDKWRLVEEFGPECFSVQQDGKLLFHADYTDKENLITWLLSFRDKVELLEPEEIREEIKDSIECMKKKYEGIILDITLIRETC